MIQEEVSQLIDDCNSKREHLSGYREAINQSQKDLLKIAAKRLEKDDLSDLEHYQNQFHIQLINIHDLKHDLKIYQNRLNTERSLSDALSNDLVQQHKELDEGYHSLAGTLRGLESDFSTFMQRPH